MQKSSVYILGIEIAIEADHKPLEFLYLKGNIKIACLQGFFDFALGFQGLVTPLVMSRETFLHRSVKISISFQDQQFKTTG